MALKHPIVPVVLGGSDYSLIAPENSYIDVKDFKNAQELAHHLNFLANNEVSFSFSFRLRNVLGLFCTSRNSFPPIFFLVNRPFLRTLCTLKITGIGNRIPELAIGTGKTSKIKSTSPTLFSR